MFWNFLFEVFKLSKNSDPDKYCYSEYGVSLNMHGIFLLSNSEFWKNVLLFIADMSSSVNNEKRYLNSWSIKGSIQWLSDTTLIRETEYLNNVTKWGKKFCLSLHYNGSNSYLFVTGVNVYKFRAKNSKLIAYRLCFGNISRDALAEDLKKTGPTVLLEVLMLMMLWIFISV